MAKNNSSTKEKNRKYQLFLALSLIGGRNHKKKHKIYFLFLLRTLVVADLADLIIAESGSNLRHGTTDSGYFDFIAKMEENVPSNFRVLSDNTKQSLQVSITVRKDKQYLCCFWKKSKAFHCSFSNLHFVDMKSHRIHSVMINLFLINFSFNNFSIIKGFNWKIIITQC